MKMSKASLATGLCLLLALLTVPAKAAGSVNVKLAASPATARPGDTVTVNVLLSGVSAAGGVAAGGVTVTYDSGKLTYLSAAIGGGKPAADLDVNASGNTVSLLYLDNKGGSNGFSGDGTLAAIRFKVKDTAPGSAAFGASASGFGDKNASGIGATASGTTLTIGAPLSADNALASLTVSNATLSPAFRPGTTRYTAEVPFSVSRLTLQAAAAHGKAKVSYSNPALKADGVTRVSVTVTAENGAKRTYTIDVHRAQDPNYVPSGDNQLAGITVEGYVLSPPFRADRTDYVVWLPYETERVKVSGRAAHGKATVQVSGGSDLKPGMDNPVQVVCVAENGDKRTYTVTLKRAPAHGEAPTPTATTAVTTRVSAATGSTAAPTGPGGSPGGLTLWLLIPGAAAGFGLGFGAALLLRRRKGR